MQWLRQTAVRVERQRKGMAEGVRVVSGWEKRVAGGDGGTAAVMAVGGRRKRRGVRGGVREG